jgi:quercetin dioxygenase-like cupin family protein
VLLIHDNYRIHAGARDQGGLSEVHEHDTDIFHILEGSATFVTGGVVVDPVIPAPGEIQGKEIKGGETWQLVKGDVIVIPPKVPHWFKEVPGTIKYFVVKVR